MQCLEVIDHNESFDPDFGAGDFLQYRAFKDSVPVVFDNLIELAIVGGLDDKLAYRLFLFRHLSIP